MPEIEHQERPDQVEAARWRMMGHEVRRRTDGNTSI